MTCDLRHRGPRPLLPILLACLLGLAVTSSAGAAEGEDGGAPSPPEDALAALEAADRSYNAAAENRDRDSLAALLRDDAVFFADKIQRGKDAFLGAWEPLFTGKYDFSYRATLLRAELAESGELGYAVGAVETRFQRPGKAEADVTESHYLNVWQRGEDGAFALRASASLVVHPEWGSAREPRTGLMTAWPELADQVGASIEIAWTPEVFVEASSGKLAFSLGSYRASFEKEDSAQAGDGHFLAVWRRDAEGRWQLAAEGFTPPDIYGD